MLESVRKWLISTFRKPENNLEKDAGSSHGYLQKVPGGEVKKTDATKKLILSKALSILEMELEALEAEGKDELDIASIVWTKGRQRKYQDQLRLIEYREKQGYDDNQQLQEEIVNKVASWREKILVGDLETFLDEAFAAMEVDNPLENSMYNRSAQYYSLMQESSANTITQQMYELTKLNLQLSFLDVVDHIQARQIN